MRRPLARVLVVAVALVAAVAANVLRVSATTVLVHHWGPAASQGLFHELFGKAVYLAVLAAFLLGAARLRDGVTQSVHVSPARGQRVAQP